MRKRISSIARATNLRARAPSITLSGTSFAPFYGGITTRHAVSTMMGVVLERLAKAPTAETSDGAVTSLPRLLPARGLVADSLGLHRRKTHVECGRSTLRARRLKLGASVFSPDGVPAREVFPAKVIHPRLGAGYVRFPPFGVLCLTPLGGQDHCHSLPKSPQRHPHTVIPALRCFST